MFPNIVRRWNLGLPPLLGATQQPHLVDTFGLNCSFSTNLYVRPRSVVEDKVEYKTGLVLSPMEITVKSMKTRHSPSIPDAC